MLAQAKRRGLYDRTIVADLTRSPDLGNAYSVVLSAGTFTHGHLGPEVLPVLLNYATEGAQFILSINAEHYETKGFAKELDLLGPQIENLNLQEVPIYGGSGAAGHAGDTAFLTMFQKC